jgi:hypothetical protein
LEDVELVNAIESGMLFGNVVLRKFNQFVSCMAKGCFGRAERVTLKDT